MGRRDWRLIRETFGSPVHVNYGANEFGIHVAQSCPDRVARGGRTAETLVLPSGRLQAGSNLGSFINSRADAIWEYQLRQTAIDHIEVTVVPAPGVTFGTAEQEDLARGLRELLGEPIGISFRLVDVIPRDPSGKRPLLKTLVGSEWPE